MNKEIKYVKEEFIPIKFIITRISKNNIPNKDLLKSITLSLSIEVLKLYNIPFTIEKLNNCLNNNTTITYPTFEKLSNNNDYLKTMLNLYHAILSIDNYEYIIELINKSLNYNIDLKNDTNYKDLLNQLRTYTFTKTNYLNNPNLNNLSLTELINYLITNNTKKITKRRQINLS